MPEPTLDEKILEVADSLWRHWQLTEDDEALVAATSLRAIAAEAEALEEAKPCSCAWADDGCTVMELCMAHRFVVEAQVSPYRTDLATATEALRVHYPRGLPTISDCTYDRKGTGAAGYAPHGCPENRSDSDPLWWCSPCRVRAALAKLEGSETKPPGHPPECRCDGCLKALAEKVRRA